MLPKISDLNLTNKKILIRVDFNVPVDNGKVTNTERIKASVPTIKYALEKNAAVILVSHFGRPKGKVNPDFSLQVVLGSLENELGRKVKFAENWTDGVNVSSGEVVLCENVRFFPEEEQNDADFAKKIANICDVFVMDAFGCAHRSHASTEGIAHFVKEKAAGLLLAKEISSLNKILRSPKKPILAVVGGSKVSSKLSVLKNLIPIVDYLIVGGGIANTFLKAKNIEVGDSLFEPELISESKELLSLANEYHTDILLPKDVVVSDKIAADSVAIEKDLNKVEQSEKILDVGFKTAKLYDDYIQKSATILWNGPVGVFEFEQFAKGTASLTASIAKSNAFSVAGGGDTIAAIELFNATKYISYISTGGGAFLEFIEGKKLPGIKVLEV